MIYIIRRRRGHWTSSPKDPIQFNSSWTSTAGVFNMVPFFRNQMQHDSTSGLWWAPHPTTSPLKNTLLAGLVQLTPQSPFLSAVIVTASIFITVFNIWSFSACVLSCKTPRRHKSALAKVLVPTATVHQSFYHHPEILMNSNNNDILHLTGTAAGFQKRLLLQNFCLLVNLIDLSVSVISTWSLLLMDDLHMSAMEAPLEWFSRNINRVD